MMRCLVPKSSPDPSLGLTKPSARRSRGSPHPKPLATDGPLGPHPDPLSRAVPKPKKGADCTRTSGRLKKLQSTSRVGERATVVILAALRRRFGTEEGSLVIAEDREESILIRLAVAVPLEIYTSEWRAEFLLSGAVDEDDYARAKEEVRKIGLDSDAIPHRRRP